MVFTSAFRKVVERAETLSNRAPLRWDLRDDQGRLVSNGLYYMRIEDGEGTETFPLVIMK
jgi:hypothetical protein